MSDTRSPRSGAYGRPGRSYPVSSDYTRDPREDGSDRTGLLVAGALALGGVVGAVVGSRALNERRTGHPDDDAPYLAARRQQSDFDVVGRTVTIARPRSEVFAFWRDFSNLPQVMENVERITPIGGDQNDWVILAPAGRKVHVRTETVDVIENERIGWRSLPDSDIQTRGHVTFKDGPNRTGTEGGRGTEVSLTIAYDPPAGELGRAVAKLFQHEPEVQSRRDLKRLKALLETGEITTNENQKPNRQRGDR